MLSVPPEVIDPPDMADALPDDIDESEPESLEDMALDSLDVEEELELELLLWLLEAAVPPELPHAVMSSAIAPIPAMVAVVLLADVRNTRPTSVS